MNIQMKFRKQEDFCHPVGTPFSSSKKWKLSIEGTEIEFKTPKHQPKIKREKADYPEDNYLYENMFFKSHYLPDRHVAEKWEYTTLFYHDWAFNGPWFTGCLANVSMSMHVYKNKEPNTNVSFFHPRAFEQTIGDFLTNQYSKRKWQVNTSILLP